MGGIGAAAGLESEESRGGTECVLAVESPSALPARAQCAVPAHPSGARHEIAEHPAARMRPQPSLRLRSEYRSWGGIGTPPR
jgi:hypothetical protein